MEAERSNESGPNHGMSTEENNEMADIIAYTKDLMINDDSISLQGEGRDGRIIQGQPNQITPDNDGKFRIPFQADGREDGHNKDSNEDETNILCVQESDESLLKRAMREELDERRGMVEKKFQLSELPSLAFTKSLPGRSSVPSSIEKIVKDRASELYVLGQKHVMDEEYAKAIAFFNKASNLDPEFSGYYIAKGEAFLQLCDFQSAILSYKKACILQPDNEDLFSRLAFLFFLHGQCYFDNKCFSDALRCFSKAVEIRPDVWTYHTRSMTCLAAEQKYAECFSIVNQRIELENDNPDLLVVRARLHRLFGNSTLAYYDAQDALKMNSEHTEALNLVQDLKLKAQTYLEQAKKMDLVGNMQRCLAKVSNAIDTDPSLGEYHSYRASLHRRNMDFNAAVDDLLIALDKSDHDENHIVHQEAHRQLLLTYNDFGVECFKKGYFEDAITLLNKAIKIEKNEKTLYVNRGDCFYQTRELHFALSDYQQALELSQNDSSVLFRLSIVYNDLGIYEYQQKRYLQAEEFFSTAVEYQPRIPSYYLSRARARYMLEDLDSARVDVISSLYLNVDEKAVASIFTRLFPGKYKSEVLSSEFGLLINEALQSVIEDIKSARMNENAIDAYPSTLPSRKDPLPRISAPAKRKVILNLRECMETQEMDINIVQEKKKINERVESFIQKKQELPREETKIFLKEESSLVARKPAWNKSATTDTGVKLKKTRKRDKS